MNRPLVALLVALFAGGIAAAPIKALLPAYVESTLNQPPTFTALLLSIQLGCGGLFALAGGALSDMVSRRAAVLVGLTTAIFGAALFAAGRPWLLIGLAVLWGIAGGFQSAGGQSFLMAAVSTARLGSASAVYFVSSTASGALGAYLGGLAADRFGFGAVTVGGAALAAVAFTLAAVFLPPLGKDTPGRQPGRWTLGGYGDLLVQRDVLLLGALRYFPTVAWGAASLAIPLLVFRLSGNKSTVGLYGMVSLLAASGAQLATGREVDRRAKRAGQSPAGSAGPEGRPGAGRAGEGSPRGLVAPLAAAILCCAVASAVLAQSLMGLIVAGTLWTMTAWALSTTMPPLIHELGRGRDDGRLVAFTHLLWSAGMLSGTLAAGRLVEWHPAGPFLLSIICLAATVVAGLAFARRRATPHHLEGSLTRYAAG